MTGAFQVGPEDVFERIYRWGWWEVVDCHGDALVLALEMQAFDSDVVAVLDLVVTAANERPQIAAVTMLGPATATSTEQGRADFIQTEVGPRYRRALAGDPCADGWSRLGPGHWQLYLLRARDTI